MKTIQKHSVEIIIALLILNFVALCGLFAYSVNHFKSIDERFANTPTRQDVSDVTSDIQSYMFQNQN